MNAPMPVVRRLLSAAIAWGLLATLAPAAHAQLAANGRKFNPPPKTLQPTPEDKAAGAPALTSSFDCGGLAVVISGTSALVSKVSCDHGFFEGTVPAGNVVVTGEPAIVFLSQSAVFGPDCTITVTGGGNTAVLSVQQNFCAAQAGQITATVTAGNATMNGTAVGSFANNIPGIVWFTTGF